MRKDHGSKNRNVKVADAVEWNYEPAAQASLIPILSTLVPTAPRAF